MRKIGGTFTAGLPALAGAALHCSNVEGASRTKMNNIPAEMEFDEVLRIQLEVLKREHRDLDQAIHALEESGRADQLALRRLKKQKLMLKDRIAIIEDRLTPDIIA